MNDLLTYREREADIERREARRVAYERVVGQEAAVPEEPRRFVYRWMAGIVYEVRDTVTGRKFRYEDTFDGRAAMWRWRGEQGEVRS